MSSEAMAARKLLSAAAVHERSEQLFQHGLDGRLRHFTIHPEKLDACADEVVKTIRSSYPALDIPFHARWRHITAGGYDRWGAVMETAQWDDAAAMARAAFDLAIISVLLDAGAGSIWRYEEGRTGETFTRSEGLAVASFNMFAGGAFSSHPEDPFRVDEDVLLALTPEELAEGFQVGPDNPIVGHDGRISLLNRLGRVIATNPDIFGRHDDPRPGGLFDVIAATAVDGAIKATTILETLLAHLGAIWPGRISLGGINLGDTWRHPLCEAGDASNGLVPFHKLSQWLSYSLIEPLQWAGYTVIDIDGLTGLPEYRNGGLFLDSGVIALKDPADEKRSHTVDSTLVVEWRALTVALLDRIADPIRTKLGLSKSAFPLAKILEGGTWATGRRLAREKRADGSPPLTIISDGTVF
ncbi:URC4/urg3 family protein [Microvirga flavescens]|uniref:URC4/urg3 family protein n=1 Tax=Microvirga flavescens TaxID=2249811 RepID=UPI000DD62EF2|nr:URC4/urg3 family protein [Microvirga flavescens]